MVLARVEPSASLYEVLPQLDQQNETLVLKSSITKFTLNILLNKFLAVKVV